MSDIVIVFAMIVISIGAGVALRWFMAQHIGTLRPYRWGVLRSYSLTAYHSVWMWRLGTMALAAIALASYEYLGVVTTVLFVASYFGSGLFFGKREDYWEQQESLTAACISRSVQV